MHHGDLPRPAVPVGVAGNGADDPVEHGGVHRRPQRGPVDPQRPAVVDGGLLYGGQQHGGGVVGVRPEGRRGGLPVLRLVLGQELVRRLAGDAVAVGPVTQVRAGEIHSLRLRQLHVIVHQQPVGPHQHHVLHAGHAPHLLGDVTALRRENREEQHLRGTGRHLRQHRGHVRIALVHRRHRGNRAPQRVEGVRKGGGQALRVGVAVVDGRGPVQPQGVVYELGHRPPLEQVVVSHPVVTRLIGVPRGALQIRGEGRGGVGSGNHHHSRVGNEGGGGHRRPRAGSPDHPHHLRVGHYLLGGPLPAVRRTQVVQTDPECHIVPLDGTVILDRHFDAPLIGNAQKGHIPRNRLQRADLNVVAGGHFHRSQSPGLELRAGGHGLRRGGGDDGGGVRSGLRGGDRRVVPAAGGGRQNQRRQERRNALVSRTNFHFPTLPFVRFGDGAARPAA